MRNRFGILACLIFAAACGQRHPGSGSKDETPTANGRTVQTVAAPVELTAGDETEVGCTVYREGAVLDEPTVVVATPAAAAITADGTGWRVRLETAGDVLVQCGTADGAVVDPEGAVVTVLPAAPASVETTLAVATSAAGLPVTVTCAVADGFGNAAPDVRATSIDVSGGLLVDPPVGAGFVVRGTTVGEATAACRVGEVVDPTPAPLTVTVGIPGQSETSVDKSSVAPREVVTASCSVTDDFGNPLTGVATELAVMAADGAPASETGLEVDGTTFSATKSGTYYVFCRVPGYAAGDESPAIVTVGWGLPCTWAVDLSFQECYWRGRKLPVVVLVYDAWGNVVGDASLSLAAVPPGSVVADPSGGWVPAVEGDLDLELSVVGDSDPTCASLPGNVGTPFTAGVRVDSTGPSFAITSPARAEAMTAGGVADQSVVLSGSVVDAVSPIVAATLNGTPLAVSGSSLVEPVSASMTSRWGLSIITGSAEDGCGNRSVLAQSFLRSGAYFPASLAPDAAARAPQGMLAQLNQSVIDDGDRTTLDDLASIGEAILKAQDFDTLIPAGFVFGSDPLRSGCSFCDWWNDTGYTLQRNSDASKHITWAGPWILSLEAVDGGLRFGIRLDNFSVPMHFQGSDRTCACGVQTTVPISVTGEAGAGRVDATGTMAVTLVGGAPQVSVQSMTLNTDNLFLTIDCGILQFVCDGLTSLVLSLLQSTIEDAIANAISGQIPPLVEGMLSGFAIESGLEIPAPMSLHLNLASGLDRVVFCGPAAGIPKPAGCPASSPNPGYGQLGLYSQLFPAARDPNIPATARGPIRKDGVLPTFSASAYQFGMGLKDDMLNQILWAVWYGGGLDLDAADLAPLMGGTGIAGVSMGLAATSPPVVMPGRDGNEIELGVGDMYVEASVDLAALMGGEPGAGTLNVGLYLSTILGGAIDIDPTTNVLQAVFDPSPTVAVQVVAIDDPAYQAVMSDLFSRLLQIVLPNLMGSVISSFPIPEINLGGIANLPTGTDAVWTLTGASIDRTPDYYRITGGLQ